MSKKLLVLSFAMFTFRANANVSVCTMGKELPTGATYFHVTTSNSGFTLYDKKGHGVDGYNLRQTDMDTFAFEVLEGDQVVGTLVSSSKLPHRPGETGAGVLDLKEEKRGFSCFSYPNIGGHP
jgi:hypothetical protein